MNTLGRLLDRGENYFGSGSHNSQEFLDFYVDFRIKFTRQLKKLNATEIEFSKNHFSFSGFFKVAEQLYYISIGDVRWNKNEMLIRTAKHNKDWSGGANNRVTIGADTIKQIARKFGLDLSADSEANATKTKDTITSVANLVVASNGSFRRRIPSTRMADSIAWKASELLGTERLIISNWRRGRVKTHSEATLSNFKYYYDTNTKTMEINFDKL